MSQCNDFYCEKCGLDVSKVKSSEDLPEHVDLVLSEPEVVGMTHYFKCNRKDCLAEFKIYDDEY